MKIAEATILIPMTILIIVSIIGLMMKVYDDLGIQIDKHIDDRREIYSEAVW